MGKRISCIASAWHWVTPWDAHDRPTAVTAFDAWKLMSTWEIRVGSVVGGSCVLARCLIGGGVFFFRNGDVLTLKCWVHRGAVAQWAVCAVCLVEKGAEASNRLDCDYPTLRYLSLSLCWLDF